MSELKCEKCGKRFSRKSRLDYHLNKKFPCDAKTLSCETCGKEFKHHASLYRHKKHCTEEKKPKLQQNNNTMINNIDNSTKNMSVDGDVKVVKFGDENLDHISDDLYKQILGRGLRSVQEFIEHSNFHPDHPENHNIYIANIRDEYIVFFDGRKWSITGRDELMEDIIYVKSDHLIVKFNELKHDMDPRDVLKFEKFIKKRDDDDVLRKIKSELTLQFYNNRYLPQRQRKKMELLEARAIRDSVNNVVSISRGKFLEICELLDRESGGNVEKIKTMLNALNNGESIIPTKGLHDKN